MRTRSLLSGFAAAAVLTTSVALTASPASAAATTAITAGTNLTIQVNTTANPAVSLSFRSVTASTTAPGQTLKVRAYVPIRHTRTGTAAQPDRFYVQFGLSCPDSIEGYPINDIRNVLVNDAATMAPQMLVTFASAGSHTCDLTYRIYTSNTAFNDTTDDMTVSADGYLTMTDPKADWAEQCYVPVGATTVPADCELSGVSAAQSKLIDFGASLDRTPVRVSIPAGTTALVRADAFLSTCGGSGGADFALCGDGWVASGRSSTIRSDITVTPVGSTDPGCAVVVDTDAGYDGQNWLDLPAIVHHGVNHDNLRFTTSVQAGCPSTYDVKQRLTVTSGEKTISHQSNTILFVEN